MPRISVIIATYNRSEVLPFSIGSVLRQTFTDWELLVVGDACTDDSAEIVRAFSAQHGEEKIRWINLEENAGNQYAPNNEGLRQARGEFIAYLGHDDLWLPHHLQTLVDVFDKSAPNEPIDIAHSLVSWVYPPQAREGFLYLPELCVTPTCVMHRRAMTETLGGWRNYREIVLPPDADLWQRARKRNFRFQFVPRLGVVKFPATARRDIYRNPTSHEQEEYSARIISEPDFEATELAKMLCSASNILSNRRLRFRQQIAFLLFREAPQRLLRRLKLKPKSKKGAIIENMRKFRGLDPKS